MRYQSNMTDVIRALTIDINKASDPTEVSRVATEQLIGDIVRRIHFQGLNASDGVISNSYSVDPIYVSIAGFVRQTNGQGKKVGAPRGKNSNDPKFKSGKPRKSRYFKDGYKEFQQEQTGNTKVNLVLTGQLQRDLQVTQDGKNFGLSFSKYGLDIYQGLENKYGVVIWFPTEKEQDRMLIAVESYINGIL